MLGKKTVAHFVSAVLIIEGADGDSDDEGQILVSQLAMHQKSLKTRTCIKNYMDIVDLYSPDDFRSHFRLKRHSFQALLEMFGLKLFNLNKMGIGRASHSPDKILLITIWMLANKEVYRLVGHLFDVSISTAWLYVHRVSTVLNNDCDNYIKWPSQNEMNETMNSFYQRSRFPGAIGCMDGSHIPISAPPENSASYINRKQYYSIQLQAICNEKYQFVDVFAGYPGSVHDARVFKNSSIYAKLCREPLPQDLHLLGDSAYPIKAWLMVPFRDNGHLTQQQRNFNTALSKSRCAIEQAFGLLKGRFRILQGINMTRVDLIPKLIVACCVLHNICMSLGDDDVDVVLDVSFNEEYHNEINLDHGIRKRNAIMNLISP